MMISWVIRKITLYSLIIFCNQVHSGEITIFSDPICPYFCSQELSNTKLPGYVFEIVNIIFAAAGHTVKFNPTPYTRSLSTTRSLLEGKQGKNEAVFILRGDAPYLLFPQEEQGFAEGCFYSNQSDSYDYKSTSLQGKVLGLKKGPNFKAIPQLSEHVKKYEKSNFIMWIHGLDTAERIFKLLLVQRLDVLAMDRDKARWNIQHLKLSSQIKESGCFKVGPAYVAFLPLQPQSKHYARTLSDGMVMLRETGQLNKILQKYNLKDWK